MAEYIEREELLGIEKLLDTEVLRASKTASNIYDQILYDIENFPAADVVPVVRCKDCSHCSIEGSLYLCALWNHLTELNDFCSAAKRREE